MRKIRRLKYIQATNRIIFNKMIDDLLEELMAAIPEVKEAA